MMPAFKLDPLKYRTRGPGPPPDLIVSRTYLLIVPGAATTTVGCAEAVAAARLTFSPATELRAIDALAKRAASVQQSVYESVRDDVGRRRSAGLSLLSRVSVTFSAEIPEMIFCTTKFVYKHVEQETYLRSKLHQFILSIPYVSENRNWSRLRLFIQRWDFQRWIVGNEVVPCCHADAFGLVILPVDVLASTLGDEDDIFDAAFGRNRGIEVEDTCFSDEDSAT
jgi:hypothetical protein